MKDINTIKIYIGKGKHGEFVYFVNSRFHSKPQPVNHYDISGVLYRIAKKVLKDKNDR